MLDSMFEDSLVAFNKLVDSVCGEDNACIGCDEESCAGCVYQFANIEE